MTIWKLGCALLALALVGAGCGGSENPPVAKSNTAAVQNAAAPAVTRPQTNSSIYPTQAQPRLRTMKVWVGAEEIIAEVAMTDIEVMTGMMHRNSIGEMEGMLFVFRYPDVRGFWMKNCIIPLSCAYIDPDGVILETHEMFPGDERPIQSKSDRVQFVLEMKEGWFKRHNIGPGVVIRTDRGSLLQTFFGQRAP